MSILQKFRSHFCNCIIAKYSCSMKKIIICFVMFFILLLQVYHLYAQDITINSVNSYADNPFNINDIQTIIQLSNNYRGQSKLSSINTTTFIPGYSGNWDQGAWFRGYYSGYEIRDFYNRVLSSHPLIRDVSKQVRSLIHLHNRFKQTNPSIVSNNIQMIKDGLSYLIAKQYAADGGYVWWYRRPGQNQYDDGNLYTGSFNTTHIYEAGHALATMSEGYLYLKKNNLLDTYEKKGLLYNAIDKAGKYILNNWGNFKGTSNYSGFGAWGLAKAYKATNNCDFLAGSVSICQDLISKQSKSGGPCDGTWQTGGEDGPDGPYSRSCSHDSRIGYHLIILKGLTETLDITPPTSVSLFWRSS